MFIFSPSAFHFFLTSHVLLQLCFFVPIHLCVISFFLPIQSVALLLHIVVNDCGRRLVLYNLCFIHYSVREILRSIHVSIFSRLQSRPSVRTACKRFVVAMNRWNFSLSLLVTMAPSLISTNQPFYSDLIFAKGMVASGVAQRFDLFILTCLRNVFRQHISLTTDKHP